MTPSLSALAGTSASSRFSIPIRDAKGPLKVEAQLLYRRARPETIITYNLPEDTYGTERRVAQAVLQVQNP